MIDLKKLDPFEFEILVGLLLQREGYKLLSGPIRPGSAGADYEAISPEHVYVVVEVKRFIRDGVGKSLMMRFAGDIHRYRQQKPTAKGLLVFAGSLSPAAMETIANENDITIWDGDVVVSLMAKHKDLDLVFQATIDARGSFQSKVQTLLTNTTSRATELCASLRGLPCGRGHWKEYERICTEILTFVFVPDLAAPDIQSRSDDGLDIIDAIFPIRPNQSPWSLVRSEYRTRFAVAEFKNHCDPIGQVQVESIAQYLWRPAQRFFGLLVSRQQPGPQAIAQRRRKWLEEEKCIVLLTDDHLCEMLHLREASEQPFNVIDAQLEDFFRTLTP
jgi:hypothetical protein